MYSGSKSVIVLAAKPGDLVSRNGRMICLGGYHCECHQIQSCVRGPEGTINEAPVGKSDSKLSTSYFGGNEAISWNKVSVERLKPLWIQRLWDGILVERRLY